MPAIPWMCIGMAENMHVLDVIRPEWARALCGKVIAPGYHLEQRPIDVTLCAQCRRAIASWDEIPVPWRTPS